MPDTLMLAGPRTARAVRSETGVIEFAGQSAAVMRARELARRAAVAQGSVLLVAERGVDVASIARDLHERSRTRAAPFITVDCAAIDPSRIDRVLFGLPGNQQPADLESVSSESSIVAARGGTMFLHDVGDLPAAAQARLARVARDGEVRIDGWPAATDCRLIASASPSIDSDVHGNRFRSDLYRRLASSRVDLPALRDRPEDVTAIAARLLDEESAANGGARRTFTDAALALLGALTWPGNIAELRDVVQRVAAETHHDGIQIEDLLSALNLDRAPASFVPTASLREARQRFEREYIAAVLQHHGWRMAEAAQTLGIQRPNLYRKARQLGIPLARLS